MERAENNRNGTAAVILQTVRKHRNIIQKGVELGMLVAAGQDMRDDRALEVIEIAAGHKVRHVGAKC
ncbi:hypothetical protein D3C73_905860 [compost metagenome]